MARITFKGRYHLGHTLEIGWLLRYLGEVDACEASMRRLVRRTAAKHERTTFRYEAGPTGYGLYLSDCM